MESNIVPCYKILTQGLLSSILLTCCNLYGGQYGHLATCANQSRDRDSRFHQIIYRLFNYISRGCTHALEMCS